MVFTVDKLTEVSAAITNFVANNDDPKAAMIPTFIMIGPANAINLFTIFFFYDGPEPPADIFADFEDIVPLLNTVKTQRYPELTDLPANSDLGQSTANGVNSFPNMPAEEMTEFLEWHWNQANDAAIKRSISRFDIQLFTMAIQPIPASMQNVSASTGSSPLAMDYRNGDKIWIEYNIGWLNPDCSEDCPKAVKDLLDEAKSHHKNNYAGVPPTNYQSGDLSYVPYVLPLYICTPYLIFRDLISLKLQVQPAVHERCTGNPGRAEELRFRELPAAQVDPSGFGPRWFLHQSTEVLRFFGLD